jgi:hypothetical protein
MSFQIGDIPMSKTTKVHPTLIRYDMSIELFYEDLDGDIHLPVSLWEVQNTLQILQQVYAAAKTATLTFTNNLNAYQEFILDFVSSYELYRDIVTEVERQELGNVEYHVELRLQVCLDYTWLLIEVFTHGARMTEALKEIGYGRV